MAAINRKLWVLQTRRCTAAAAAWNLKQPTHLLMGLPRRRGRTLLSFHCEYYKIASVLRERNPAFPHKDVCVFVFLFFKCRKKTHRASSVMRFNRWDNEPSGGGVCSLAERTELGWVTCTPEFLLVDSVVFISWCHNGRASSAEQSSWDAFIVKILQSDGPLIRSEPSSS